MNSFCHERDWHDSKKSHERCDFGDFHGKSDFDHCHERPDFRDFHDKSDFRDFRNFHERVDFRESADFRDFHEKPDFHNFHDFRDFHNFHDFHDHGRHDCPDERELVLKSSFPRNRQTGVSPHIKCIRLEFGHGMEHACSIEVDMWKDGTRVPIRVSESRDRCFRTNVIKVIPVKPLAGGVLYKVRVKAFFPDHCGETVKKAKMISFRTGCK